LRTRSTENRRSRRPTMCTSGTPPRARLAASSCAHATCTTRDGLGARFLTRGGGEELVAARNASDVGDLNEAVARDISAGGGLWSALIVQLLSFETEAETGATGNQAFAPEGSKRNYSGREVANETRCPRLRCEFIGLGAETGVSAAEIADGCGAFGGDRRRRGEC